MPEAPPIIEDIKALNSTAVQIWWTPPDPQKINGINQGYKLQAWKYDISKLKHVEARRMTVHPNLLDPLAKQTAVITGLEKFSEYNVTVLCFTDPGDGEISEFNYVKTMEDGMYETLITNLSYNRSIDNKESKINLINSFIAVIADNVYFLLRSL